MDQGDQEYCYSGKDFNDCFEQWLYDWVESGHPEDLDECFVGLDEDGNEVYKFRFTASDYLLDHGPFAPLVDGFKTDCMSDHDLYDNIANRMYEIYGEWAADEFESCVRFEDFAEAYNEFMARILKPMSKTRVLGSNTTQILKRDADVTVKMHHSGDATEISWVFLD